MSDIEFRRREGEATDPFLLWDSVWFSDLGTADWRIAGPGEFLNRGGLQSRQAIASAVVIALFTDRRCPDDHPLRWLADADPRGWFGDGVDVHEDSHEADMGSLLWLLDRAPLDDFTERWAEHFAREALAPLLAQQTVTRINIEAKANKIVGRLELLVQIFGRDSALLYDQKFETLWNQVTR